MLLTDFVLTGRLARNGHVLVTEGLRIVFGISQDEPGDGGCGQPVKTREDVSIGIEGDGGDGMPHLFAHHLGRYTSSQRCACIRVSEIVQADLRQPGGFGEALEAIGEEVGMDRVSVRAGEHEARLDISLAHELLLSVPAPWRGHMQRVNTVAGRPGNHESAGKQRSGRSRKGPKWLGIHLTEAAKAAGRSKDTYLGAQYQRLRGRRGTAKATKAVGHSILVAAYHILDRRVPYHDLGADWFVRRRPEARCCRQRCLIMDWQD